MRSWKTILAAAAAMCALTGGAQATALLVDSSGKLTGATGVKVYGETYDVTFVEGSCSAVFNGCDSAADFTFTTLADTYQASLALLDTVLVNGPQGQFDAQPELTFGCSATDYCWVMTPYAASWGDVQALEANNRSTYYEDRLIYDTVRIGDSFWIEADMGNASDKVWAVWTLASTQPPGLPEPGTPALIGLALGVLALRRRRH